MAIQFPKFNFAAVDAKTRVLIVFVAIGIIGLIFFGVSRYFGSGKAATGPSKVATAPAGLQSVPGGQLSPEYYRALMQANVQSAQQAKITGGSAVSTLINPGQQNNFSSASCTILCPSPDDPNVENDINSLVQAGKLSQDDANKLLALSKNNVSPEEYAVALNELVRSGKLTPEQARQLLADYKKQHANLLAADSAKTMDGLIRSGQLSLDTANQLLTLQRARPTVAEYAAELNRLAQAGKISPQVASQLLSQYAQQQAQELKKQGNFSLRQMAKAGEITQDVANQLAALQDRNVPVDQYADALQKLVAAGKLTPAAAARLLAEYKKQRGAVSATGALDALADQAANAAAGEVSALVKNGRLSPDMANALLALQQKNVSPEDYKNALAQLVQQGKLTPAEANALLASYQKAYALKAESERLKKLQGNNASIADYTNELKQAVQNGIITPEMAANLLRQYQAMMTPVPTTGIAPTVSAAIPGAEDFAKLQQRLQAEQATTPTSTTGIANDTQAFAAAEAQAEAEASQARAERIAALESRMSNQVQSLLTAWQPVTMEHRAGESATDKNAKTEGSGKTSGKNGPATPPLIKAGTILFAILDTAVDSDYPSTPVMATIINGKFKGSKLLGKIALAQGPNYGQGQDRVSLSFTLMNKEDWTASKSVSAFAIDPDTARAVMASSVNYHYLMRYGSLFASSFLSGYASAISNSGSTSTPGIFGTTTTHSPMSPGEKIAVGLGQVGTALTNVVSNYTNIPPTVKVNSGVGLGILFMADVTE